MKSVGSVLLILILLAAAGTGGYLLGHRGASPAAAGDPDDSDDTIDPTPTVQTAPITQGRIDRTIVAYGVVAAQPADVSVLSVGFESRVKKVLVVPGQRLDSAGPVIDLEPSPDTQLQLLQAKAALDAAKKDNELTGDRFSHQLATNEDLSQSEQNLQISQLKLDSMQKQGAGGDRELRSAGLVSKVDVQEGQIVPAGAALVELTGQGKLQVALGVEPSDSGSLHAGDSVSLRMVNADGSPVVGKILMIAQRVNPDTRLVDVLVSIPPDSAMPLDTYVRGEIILPGSQGLVVPRSAVLPADEGYSLFTVEQGKAVEHDVTLLAHNDDSFEIAGEGLSVGQPVVVTGNMELETGMSVTVGAAATQPTSQAAAQEAAQ
jgi:RND family efflux transporter MFP subunit